MRAPTQPPSHCNAGPHPPTQPPTHPPTQTTVSPRRAGLETRVTSGPLPPGPSTVMKAPAAGGGGGWSGRQAGRQVRSGRIQSRCGSPGGRCSLACLHQQGRHPAAPPARTQSLLLLLLPLLPLLLTLVDIVPAAVLLAFAVKVHQACSQAVREGGRPAGRELKSWPFMHDAQPAAQQPAAGYLEQGRSHPSCSPLHCCAAPCTAALTLGHIEDGLAAAGSPQHEAGALDGEGLCEGVLARGDGQHDVVCRGAVGGGMGGQGSFGTVHMQQLLVKLPPPPMRGAAPAAHVSCCQPHSAAGAPSVSGCLWAHARAATRVSVSLMPPFLNSSTDLVTGGVGSGSLPCLKPAGFHRARREGGLELLPAPALAAGTAAGRQSPRKPCL